MCTPYMARGEGMFLVPLAPGPGPWTAQSPVLDAWQHGQPRHTEDLGQELGQGLAKILANIMANILALTGCS